MVIEGEAGGRKVLNLVAIFHLLRREWDVLWIVYFSVFDLGEHIM